MSYDVRAFDPSSISPPSGIEGLVAWLKEKPIDAPLDIEIGCGTGWHPIRYSIQHPERRVVAFEHTRAKFERFSTRLKHHRQIENLYAVHGEAIRWITHALQPETVDRYFLLYPNPEPKAPNKRWMRSPAMHRILETLKAGGEINMATNEEWYAHEALEWAEKAWKLELVSRRELTLADLSHARTHFEKKYLARGESCFDLRWRKVRC